MSLFVCKKCGCIENTALGHYWTRNRIELFTWPPELEAYKGEPLCSECAPPNFADGAINPYAGKWHGKFNKDHWSKKFEKEPHGLF